MMEEEEENHYTTTLNETNLNRINLIIININWIEKRDKKKLRNCSLWSF